MVTLPASDRHHAPCRRRSSPTPPPCNTGEIQT